MICATGGKSVLPNDATDPQGLSDSSPDDSKEALRRQFRQARRLYTTAQRRAAAQALIEEYQRRWPQAPLAAYMATGSEVDTQALIEAQWSQGQSVWLPMVAGQDLQWYAVLGPQQLRSGYRSIREPDPRRCAQGQPDAGCVVLVPGLAFTEAGDRLGQGGGFYDRAIPGLRQAGCRVVGVAYATQLVARLPQEPHDQSVDEVLLLEV